MELTKAVGLAVLAAAPGNVVLVAAAAWAVVSQYPYPEGNSVVPFAALATCTPILSLMALLRGPRSGTWEKRPRTPGGG